MPVQECIIDGVAGFKWGESGKCYTGSDAKERALEQGRAILAQKNALIDKTKEAIQLELQLTKEEKETK